MMTLMTGLCTTTAAQKPWAHAEMQDSDEEIWQCTRGKSSSEFALYSVLQYYGLKGSH